MTIYKYIALTPSGDKRQGQIEANDIQVAAANLRGQSLSVLDIVEATQFKFASKKSVRYEVSLINRLLGVFKFVNNKDRVQVLGQIALMIRSGLTLLKALDICSHQTKKIRLHLMLTRVRDRINQGSSFSAALDEEPSLFPNYIVRLIESAEVSGELDETLERAAHYLEKKSDATVSLITSLMYPAIVVLTTIGIFIILVTFVIPKFATRFAQKSVALPASTQFMLDLSEFMVRNKVLLLSLFNGFVVGMALMYLLPKGRYFLHRIILKMPVFGSLFTASAMVNMTFTMHMLLKSGVTLLSTLKITSKVVNNLAFANLIEKASENVLKGKKFADSLQHPLFPEIFHQIVSVGERTGSLVEVLEELGKHYNKKLEQLLSRMAALIEPILIAIIGGMVGFVYYSFFQASMSIPI